MTKEMLMPPYPINEPPPSYEQIDNIIYERADEVRTNDNVGHECRDNPLYDFGLQNTSPDNPLYGRINKDDDPSNVLMSEDGPSRQIMQNQVSSEAMDTETYNDFMAAQTPTARDIAFLNTVSGTMDKSQS